jgi:hypothetical protein
MQKECICAICIAALQMEMHVAAAYVPKSNLGAWCMIFWKLNELQASYIKRVMTDLTQDDSDEGVIDKLTGN